MKLNTCVISVASLTLLVVATNGERQQRNDVLDQVLLDVFKQYRNELEPVPISDQGMSYGMKLARMNVTGEAMFSDIKLHGMSTIRRTGDAYVEKTRIGDYIISGKLAMGVLNIDMSGTINFLGIGPKRDFIGRIVHIDADLIVLYSAVEKQFKLKKFEINDLEGFTLRLKSKRISFINAIGNRVMNRLLSSFERITKQTIEDAFSKILARVMNKSNILKTLLEREQQHEKLMLG